MLISKGEWQKNKLMAKKSHKKARQQHRIIAIVIIIILLIGASVAAWFVFNRPAEQPKKNATTDTRSYKERVGTAVVDADQKAQSGDVAKGAEIYDDLIDDSTDDRTKAQLLAAKASLYVDAKKYDQALPIALEADRLVKLASLSVTVAHIYEAMGNKAQAATYYEKAASNVNPKLPMADSDKEYYLSKARELRGQ